MDKAAIEKIEELVKASLAVVTRDGQEYTSVGLTPVFYNPKPSAVVVHNLRGFCGFINNDINKLIKEHPMLIVVNSPKSVDLISAVDEVEKKRTILVSARISDKLQEFPFGTFLLQEEFAIVFRSLFVSGKKDDFEYVLSYASKLTGGTQIDGDDDGITQKVTVKRGLCGLLRERILGIWTLSTAA